MGAAAFPVVGTQNSPFPSQKQDPDQRETGPSWTPRCRICWRVMVSDLLEASVCDVSVQREVLHLRVRWEATWRGCGGSSPWEDVMLCWLQWTLSRQMDRQTNVHAAVSLWTGVPVGRETSPTCCIPQLVCTDSACHCVPWKSKRNHLHDFRAGSGGSTTDTKTVGSCVIVFKKTNYNLEFSWVSV